MSDLVSCYCSDCNTKTLRKVEGCKCTSNTGGNLKNSAESVPALRGEQQLKDSISLMKKVIEGHDQGSYISVFEVKELLNAAIAKLESI